MHGASPEPTRVPSSGGVVVAIHDFGGAGRPLLFSHATGFHGWCYEPMAQALVDRFHCYALDYRGHGMSEQPLVEVDWARYGDDAVAAGRAIAPDGGLLAFGHSMGGAALLMAAHREPDLFDLIVAFEPIVYPPLDPHAGHPPSPLVEGARRRRRSFESTKAAYENYAAKPPLGSFTPAALRAYVEHGFRPDGRGGVTLRCDPEHEARTFELGAAHRTWDLLPDVTTPVVVVAGMIEEWSPAAIAEPIAEHLPHAEFVHLPHLDHFGPMTHPDELADLLAGTVARITGA